MAAGHTDLFNGSTVLNRQNALAWFDEVSMNYQVESATANLEQSIRNQHYVCLVFVPSVNAVHSCVEFLVSTEVPHLGLVLCICHGSCGSVEGNFCMMMMVVKAMVADVWTVKR